MSENKKWFDSMFAKVVGGILAALCPIVLCGAISWCSAISTDVAVIKAQMLTKDDYRQIVNDKVVPMEEKIKANQDNIEKLEVRIRALEIAK